MIEEIFKQLNIVKGDKVDKAAMLKHIDQKISQASWKAPMKASVELCHKYVTNKRDEIVKDFQKAPFNFTKDQCNPIFLAALNCFYYRGVFMVSESE